MVVVVSFSPLIRLVLAAVSKGLIVVAISLALLLAVDSRLVVVIDVVLLFVLLVEGKCRFLHKGVLFVGLVVC